MSLILVALLAAGGGSHGAELYHNTRPACVACHNPRRGSLVGSRLSRPEIKTWIRKGKPPEMPAYKLSEQELEALADYLESLRKKK